MLRQAREEWLTWGLIGLGAAMVVASTIGCGAQVGAAPDAASELAVDAADHGDARPALADAAAPADAAVFDPGPEPTDVIRPAAGELTIIQLALPAGITVRMGEAALIVGPDGTLVLLDVGNSNHDDEVRAAVRELNTLYLTPERGFAARAPLQVEWVVITHVHGDHAGAFRDLFVATDEPLEVVHGVVHRGLVDLGGGMNTNDYQELCGGLRGALADREIALCSADEAAPCDFAALGHPHVASACDGLFAGDLSVGGDDGAPSFIELGGGARITLIGANGYASDGERAVATSPFGHDTGDEENARSVVGIVEHGDFRYHFGGDLHGRASDGPDTESHLVAIAGPAYYDSLGVDVIHAHHHARRTSSNATFVGAAAPADGRSRNVVAGINAAHLGSPFPEVLEAWGGGGRLADGGIWVTEVTAGGATSDELVIADGPVIVQTIQAGLGYRVQAAGLALTSRAFRSVRARETP